jgi:flagellum-specific peptidoglycan hydrolase FlgJ
VKGGKWEETITSIFIVVCLLTCNLCVVVVLSKIAPQQQAASSKQQAASSKQQAASSKQQAASSKQQAASSKQQAAAATEVQAHHKLLNDHFFRAFSRQF